MPRMPAHQVTTRNLGAAYPFIAEAGLGRRGVVIGDDLLGGSFVFDPFELYAAGVVSIPTWWCSGRSVGARARSSRRSCGGRPRSGAAPGWSIRRVSTATW